jgi:beta-galactosidase
MPERWRDPGALHAGTEKPAATRIAFADTQSARTLDPALSPFQRSLNGAWTYRWSATPAERPIDFWREDFDASTWTTLHVPSNPEVEGFGVPIYTNIRYPWAPEDPPHIPADALNHVSSYRRTFEVPEAWVGREVFVTFHGVNSCFTAWLNGREIGFGTDSRTPSTFRLTPYVKSGDNLLAVEVFRWGAASYLEDQDFWRLSGIFRDVVLWSAPSLHLRDFEVRTVLDADYRDAVLGLRVELTNFESTARAASIDVELLDPAGQGVLRETLPRTVVDGADTASVRAEFPVGNPPKWSAETPHLHTLLLTLRDEHGRVLEVGWVSVRSRSRTGRS